MKSKKVILIIISIVLLIVLLMNNAFAEAEEPRETIVLSVINSQNKKFSKDEIITLEVQMAALSIDEGVNVIELGLEFDKSLLEINTYYDEDEEDNVLDIKGLRDWKTKYVTDADKIRLTRLEYFENLNQSILRIKFKVKEDFTTTNIKFKNIRGVGGGLANTRNAYSEDVIVNLEGSKAESVDNLYLKSKVYKIGEQKLEEIDEYTNSDEYISRVTNKTSISSFISNLITNAEVKKVFDKDGNEITDLTTYVGTGMTLKLSKTGCDDIEVLIAVTGDVSGDGLVTPQDLSEVVKISLDAIELEEIQMIAIDFSEDGEITAQDLSEEIKLSLE